MAKGIFDAMLQEFSAAAHLIEYFRTRKVAAESRPNAVVVPQVLLDQRDP